MLDHSPSHRPHHRPSLGKPKPSQPQASAGSKRILLLSRNDRLVAELTRRLSSLGHRVWTVSSEDDGPTRWSPHLYDFLVFSAEDTSDLTSRFCEAAKKADSRLFLVMLARHPFATVIGVPDAIINEEEEPAIAEKLVAVVNGGIGQASLRRSA